MVKKSIAERVFWSVVTFGYGVIALGLVLTFPGCAKSPGSPTSNTVAITGAVPVIDLPVKPVLESLDPDELADYSKLSLAIRTKLQMNDKKLKVYAAQMQVGIEDYNTYAAVRNQQSKTDVGVKGAE